MLAQNVEKNENGREFDFKDSDYRTISKLVYEYTRINLGEHKKDMVYGRLSRRIRSLKLGSFSAYIDYLNNNTDKELTNFVNAITTNLTSFFRENNHFEFLTNKYLPYLEKEKQSNRKIRVWSAGCSTGEEPYSIAITLHDYFSSKGQWDIKILATDIDSNVLQHGTQGIYDYQRVEALAPQLVAKHFDIDGEGIRKKVTAKQHLKELIKFNRLNLMTDWPMKNQFDIIFCRNVVIYFDKDTQKILFDKYASQLQSHGRLFIGHSETLNNITNRFELIEKSTYRKVC